MVNELQSQEWAYLLDPCFQLVNTNGRPLTNGHIEVFYHGTRTPYYCASDWNGTLHPFKIKIDSLGSNVVLADPNYAYDVYVYNAYGVLQMSRYNVHPGSGSGSGTSSEGGDAAHWIGKSGATVSVPKTIATTLPLPSNPDYEGDFASIVDNTFTLAPGLYMVDCLVDFRQSSSDLTNKIGSIKFYTSDSSDPIEGQIFERNETGPDASGDSHQVQVSFVRHVAEVDDDDALRFEMASSNDLTYARIDRLSIVKLEQGGGGTAYAAGYGIDITGQVISTSGMMPEASAANFVNVETYNTDIQNIYETIAETSAMIPSGVATEQWVEDYTSAFITEDALNGYATEQWVEDQHYITSADIPPIPQDVITSGELATVSGDIVAQIPSLDGYATQDWVVEQGYLTSADLPQSVPLVAGEGISIVDTSASTIISVDSAYSPGVSEEWVEEYVSDATSGFITSADIPDVPEDLVTSAELATVSGDIVSQIPDVSDMATQTWVNEQGFLTSLPDDLVTSGELATVSGDIMSQMPSQTTVSIDPTLSSGTKIAEFNINGTSGSLYAPQGGSGGSDVFIAEAFVTSYQEVSDAYDAGKTIFAHYDGSYGGAPNTTYVLSTRAYNRFYFTCIQAENRQGAYLNTISVTPSGWATGSYFQYAVPTPIFTNPVGSVLTKVDANNNMGWTVPQSGGSEVDIIPTLQTGTKIADYVIDGTSGELYAPEGGGSTYNGIKPISVQGSDISLMYGETLTCPDPDPIQCQYRMRKDGDYAYFNNSSYDIESTNSCDIVFPDSTTVVGTPGDTLRLRLTDESNSLYIDGTVNLVSNGSTVYLMGGPQTFYLRSSVMRPSGRTWADMFDFSQYSISDIEGDVRIELWEFNGDTPVQHLEMSYNELLIYTNAVPSYLNVTYPVPSPTYNQGYVLTENGDGTYGWAQGGGSVPEDVVTSGQLATVSGEIMNEIPNYTAGDNVSIVNDEISVSGTAGLIAGDNISITASGDNYIISSSASGGEITFPLEVSGSTNVYEARDGLTSGYVNAGEIYVGYHDDGGGGEPDIDTVSITPYQVEVKGDFGGVTPTSTLIQPGIIQLDGSEGESQYVDFYKVENWDNTYNAVDTSAAYWNSSIFSDQITSAALVNSLPADASAHPNYLYLIPEA